MTTTEKLRRWKKLAIKRGELLAQRSIWHPFDESMGWIQGLPEPYRRVLVALPEGALSPGTASATVVGYLKFAAGDKSCPYFVVPGVGGKPTHWCDCLASNFGEAGTHPYWKFPARL